MTTEFARQIFVVQQWFSSKIIDFPTISTILRSNFVCWRCSVGDGERKRKRERERERTREERTKQIGQVVRLDLSIHTANLQYIVAKLKPNTKHIQELYLERTLMNR